MVSNSLVKVSISITPHSVGCVLCIEMGGNVSIKYREYFYETTEATSVFPSVSQFEESLNEITPLLSTRLPPKDYILKPSLFCLKEGDSGWIFNPLVQM